MEMEMERRKLWLSSIINNLFLLPAKNIVVTASSLLRHKAKEKSEGLVTLYKDMEACSGYADIRVMWEMIHSSCPPYVESSRSSKRIKLWKFCFQET
ncbi:UNVERIFIED_CONTAM: hypothetical protein Slati_2796100 [Sesamum latifolium]|uniref:Uncharacterized protein n=1 Tax=Sesamum latifolium TaxID=2727402 RepID=A0AAW2VAY8_9LAMI